MKVKIPFRKQFEQVMLSGKKISTIRTKRYGKIGDTFEAFGAEFKIIAFCPSVALWAGKWLYKEEGFEQLGEFWKVWDEINPNLERNALVFVYFFKRLG